MRKITAILLFSIGLFCSENISAQNGLDPDFQIGDGTGLNNPVNAIAIQSNGQIIIGGAFSSYNGILTKSVARINPDGSADGSFSSVIEGHVFCVAVQPDGKIIAGGIFTYPTTNLVRLNTDGSIDNSFDVGSGLNAYALSVVVLSDTKILVGGSFTTYNGITQHGIIRLENDGAMDMSFNNSGTGTSGFYLEVQNISIQSDNKIIISGPFTNYNNVNRNGLARLNADGSLDLSFDVGTGGFGIIENVLQSDGKIIIGGLFTSYNGIPIKHLARINPDGSLDPSFNPGSSTASYSDVRCVALQNDGKILVGGGFTSYNGFPKQHLMRLFPDGSIDHCFASGTKDAGNGVMDIKIQSDEKIVIGGYFSECNNLPRNNVTRLLETNLEEISVNATDFCFPESTDFSFSLTSILDSVLWTSMILLLSH